MNENDKLPVKPVDMKSQWIKRLTIIVAIWGVLSLLFSSAIFGIIFILFAVFIRAFRSFIIIYALVAVLWLLGLMQLLNATGVVNLGFTVSEAQGIELILVAIANFAVGALIFYRTRKLEFSKNEDI